MSRPMIHDGETTRQMTDREYDEWQQLSDEVEARHEAALQAKTSAITKLKALGLTDAEIAALLG